MEIRCRCSACQAKFKVAAKYAGKKARCPKCQQVVSVPLGEGLEAAPVSPIESSIVQAAEPSAPEPVPPEPAQPAPSDLFAGLKLSGGPRPAATRHESRNTKHETPHARPSAATPAGPGKKELNPRQLWIAGGVAVALLAWAIGLVTFYFRPRPPANVVEKIDDIVKTGIVYLDWPVEERDQAMLLLDGLRETVPPNVAIRLEFQTGKHKLQIRRRGFESFERDLVVGRGTTEHVAPVWKAVLDASAPSGQFNLADTPQPAAAGVKEVPGFEGWTQLLKGASRRAADEKKDVLLVCGCSDSSEETRKLAESLHQLDVQAQITARFVPIVIDIPQTLPGDNRVLDRVQNAELRSRFFVDSLPTVVLLDAQERPYFVQRQWPDGFGGLAAIIEGSAAQRAERDRLWLATSAGGEPQRLAAAAVCSEWLMRRKLGRAYQQDIAGWLQLAERLDPQNAAGHLEAVFELRWTLKLAAAEGPAQVLAASGELQPWLSRRFTSDDRGVRTHIAAAAAMYAAERDEDCSRHLERALTYKPSEKGLQEKLAEVRRLAQAQELAGAGTGFLVTATGHVLTNHHVIAGHSALAVRIPGRDEPIAATLVAQDIGRDLALLQLTWPANVKAQPLALASSPVRRGTAVAAFGYPLQATLGSGLKFTAGTVSALPDESNEQRYFLDLTVNPGNSGGPLCDGCGNAIGMISGKTGSSERESSLAVAIPAADLAAFLDKHLPAGTARATAATGDARLGWDQVDERVSGGVLAILKK